MKLDKETKQRIALAATRIKKIARRADLHRIYLEEIHGAARVFYGDGKKRTKPKAEAA